jgi:hypothetical protein
VDLKHHLEEPRRRHLAILAITAALSLLLAALALHIRAAQTAPQSPPHHFLAGFAGKLNRVASVRIESAKDGVIEAVFLPLKGWVLPAHDNFPVSFDMLRRTLKALATMETIEPQTAQPEWFHYVDLDAPPHGGGILVTVRDGEGKVLATLIAGKSEDIGDPGAIGLFVRKPNEKQSWLVRSSADLHSAFGDWMDKKILDIDRTRIAEVTFRPVSGPTFAVHRDAPTDADFKLDSLPHGRTLLSPTAADDAGSALSGFTFDDAVPRTDFDFDVRGARVVSRTFDGLTITVDVVRDGKDYWARVTASAAPGNFEAGKEARAINAKTYGWAFKLPADKGGQFLTTLDSLLQPVGKQR